MRRLWLAASFFCFATGLLYLTLNSFNSAEAVPQSHEASDLFAGQSSQSSDRNTDRYLLGAEEAAAAAQAGIMPATARSVLVLDNQLQHGEYVWNDRDVPSGPVSIWVDLRSQLISVFRGGHEIGAAVIVYGASGNATPLGVFSVLSKRRDYHSRSYDADMPYSLFITDDGVALHGSVMNPRHATHGCVGLPEEFARLLFAATEPGAIVEITRSRPEDIDKLIANANPALR